MLNLDGRQSGQTNDYANIVKHANERAFALAKCQRNRNRLPNGKFILLGWNKLQGRNGKVKFRC